MLAGHFATALVAKQQAPKGRLIYYLVASQMLDLLWLSFHYLGLEPTHPSNAMAVSLDSLQAEMTYSHDVLPTLAWVLLVGLIGRGWFGSWRVAIAGSALVAVHGLTDYAGGYPHHLFGPETATVGTGMYLWAPYLAVVIEVIFTAIMLFWVWRTDVAAGFQRGVSTWLTWAVVFGGALAFLLLIADRTMAEWLGMAPLPVLGGTTVPLLIGTYLPMIAALVWADRTSSPAVAG